MIDIVVSTAAITALALSCIVITRKRNAHGSLILVMTFVSLAAIVLIEQFMLNSTRDPVPYTRVLIILESFLPFLFLMYGFIFSRKGSLSGLSLPWKSLLIGSGVFPLVAGLVPLEYFFYSPDMQSDKILFLRDAGYWFYMGEMVYCIVALTNLESTFSSAVKGEQWRIKFELFGMGSIIAVFLFYFSQGLLYRTINMNLIPLRSGVIIVAVGMVLYSKLVRGNNVKIAVSMSAAYRSFTILVVGVYLLMLGLVGEGMRYLGVKASAEITVFLAFITGILLLLALFSGRVRRTATVLIRKNFFRHKYDYREEWLKYTRELASCGSEDEVRQRILGIYAETFGLRGISLFMRKENDRVFFSVAWRGSASAKRAELRASDSLLQYFKENDRVYDPKDGEHLPTEEEREFVEECGAHLLVPLIRNEIVTGLIVFGEQLSRETYIYEDYDLMKTLAREASLSLANIKLSEELAETREVAAVAKISSFVIHDLKNHISSLSMMLENAEAHIDNPEFQADMLGTVKGTVEEMRKLIQKLRNLPEKQSLQTSPVDILALVKSEVEGMKRVRPQLQFCCEGDGVVARVDGEEFKKVVLNLLVNACDATDGKGMVTIQIGRNGETAHIRVIDNGCGMKREFMEAHLFKPFRTTKRKGLGIGLYQCRQIVEAHGGSIEARSSLNAGSAFTVHLPAHGE